MTNLALFIFIFNTLSCATITLPRKVMVKRDRFGEGLVVDYRDGTSTNEFLYTGERRAQRSEELEIEIEQKQNELDWLGRVKK